MNVLAQIGGEIAALRDLAGQAEIKIGKVEAGGVGARSTAAFRSGGLAEAAGEGVLSVQRVDVENFRPDGQKLIAELDGVASADDRIIQFRV